MYNISKQTGWKWFLEHIRFSIWSFWYGLTKTILSVFILLYNLSTCRLHSRRSVSWIFKFVSFENIFFLSNRRILLPAINNINIVYRTQNRTFITSLRTSVTIFYSMELPVDIPVTSSLWRHQNTVLDKPLKVT